MVQDRGNSAVAQLWGGRFSQGIDEKVLAYSASLHLDRRLARYDIEGSRAHAQMLYGVGLLSSSELQTILNGLTQIATEIAEQTFPFRPELEDIHMNIESRLTDLVGDAGRKLHTGRSRNDQVALDLRLYTRDIAGQWRAQLAEIIKVILNRSETLESSLFPGWTHLQAAQPISWAHYLLSFAQMFKRDIERLDSYLERSSISPLGAGALAGSTLPLDPRKSADLLGFRQVFSNSYDVVGDRDFILELLQIASQIMIHVSRLAEDLVYLSSTLVGLIELPDALCTGSSMMPQKKNPDIMELARGKSATVLGCCQAMAILLKGLPSSYNRDLQQDKEHLFPAVDIVGDTLALLPEVVGQFEVVEERCVAMLERGFLMATDLAEVLVKRGIPFRNAHEIVGKTVAFLGARGETFANLQLSDLQKWYPEADSEILQSLLPARVLEERKHVGSTGREAVRLQISHLREWLGHS